MKAICQFSYQGPEFLSLNEVQDKGPPNEHEVLIQVRFTSLHPDIWHVVTGNPKILRLFGSGLTTPAQKIPGTDLSGIVKAVGDKVTRFRPGDLVYGDLSQGMQWKNRGTYAELALARESHLHLIPDFLSMEEAAAIPTSGWIAYRCLFYEGRIRKGQKLLINGAGGSLGTLAIQIARYFDAEITAIDQSDKLNIIRSLAPCKTLDYQTQNIQDLNESYDLILDIASTLKLNDVQKWLNPGGFYILVGHDHFGASGSGLLGSLPKMIRLSILSLYYPFLPKASGFPPAEQIGKELATIVSAGAIKPVIDQIYPLENLQEAFDRMISGKATGKIILRI